MQSKEWIKNQKNPNLHTDYEARPEKLAPELAFRSMKWRAVEPSMVEAPHSSEKARASLVKIRRRGFEEGERMVWVLRIWFCVKKTLKNFLSFCTFSIIIYAGRGTKEESKEEKMNGDELDVWKEDTGFFFLTWGGYLIWFIVF